MTPPFVTEPLGPHHDRDLFRSGSDLLDRYLRERASQDVRRRVAGCFVAVDPDSRIAGFYTLAATSVLLDGIPKDAAKGLPRYPVIPAILIGRLAVALEHQGKGLGSALLADAVIRIDRLGIGAFAMMVDAQDDRAAAFYRSNGFIALPGEIRRLMIPIETAVKALRSK